jgi:hypothetical protein
LRPFFRVTSVLLYALAIVFIGQGIASLQEASVVKATFVPFMPTIQALGIFPTVQTLGAQLVLFLFSAGAFLAPLWQKGLAGHGRNLAAQMKKGQRSVPAPTTQSVSSRP